MEISPALIYWITRLTGIKETLCVTLGMLALLSMAFLIMSLIVGSVENDVNFRKPVKYALFSLTISSLMLIAVQFIPTTKEMAAILIIPRIAKDNKIKKLPNNLVDFTNEWLEELKPKRN